MKKILLTSALLAAALLASATSVSAATYNGQLVKASGPAVYYVNSVDGKRYVFPNEATYKSWYSDFSSVVTITDYELASLMIGGNVTYRPGTKLVKITTDPKVYAISGGSYLRWVSSEAVAQTLFGASWASNVNDIPDAFFINYRIGAPIQTVSEYQPTQELNGNATIDADLWKRNVIIDPVFPVTATTTQPVTPTSTTPVTPTTTTPITPVVTAPTSTTAEPGSMYQGALSVRETQPIASGSGYTVVALPSPSGGLTTIRIQSGSSTTITCDSDYCQPRFTAPVVTATTTQTITAVFTWLGSHRVTTTNQVTIVPVPSSNQITFTSFSTTTHTGDSRTAQVQIGSDFSAHIIRMYMDGLLVKECTDDSLCIWSDPERGATGTQHVFTAQAEDREGRSIQSRAYTMTVLAR